MMKRVLAVLILCLALAVVRILLMVLAVVLLLALVHAFVTRPKETLVFLGTVILSSLAVAQPLAFVMGAAAIVMTALLAPRLKRSRRRHLAPNR